MVSDKGLQRGTMREEDGGGGGVMSPSVSQYTAAESLGQNR